MEQINKGRTAVICRYDSNRVIKLYRQSFPLKGIEDEFQINQALYVLGLDIPKAYEITRINDSIGIVFDYINGKSMLQNLSLKPWMVWPYAKQMAQLHWRIHGTTVEKGNALHSLNESLVSKINRVSLLTGEEKAKILSHLSTLPDGSGLCHGDFHPDNIIISKNNLVTVDWLTARIGNTLADVARTSLLLTMGTLPENKSKVEVALTSFFRSAFHRCYMREYQMRSNVSSHKIEQWILPVAAARLIENVSEQENGHLLDLIRTLLLRKQR